MNRSLFLGLVFATAGAACSSSSGGNGGSPDSGSGSGSGSGSSSGGGSGGSSGSSSGSSSGGMTGGVTQLATTPSQPHALLLTVSTLYWVELKTGIKSVPVGGGTPKVVLPDANIDGNLATDGTLLYYTHSTATASELDAVGLDGSGQKMVATGFESTNNSAGSGVTVSSTASQLFVVAGDLYLSAALFIMSAGENKQTVVSVPTSGGTLTDVFSGVPITSGVLDLTLADASGLYFELDDSTANTTYLGYAPLAGASSIASLYAPPSTLSNIYFDPLGGELVTSGGSAYFMVRTGGEGEPKTPGTTTLMKSAPPSGPASVVSTYANETLCGMVADNSGMFAIELGSGNGMAALPGGAIFKVDPSTGAQTQLYAPQATATGLDSLIPYIAALDASNVYFAVTVSGPNTTYAIESVAR